MSEVRTRAQPRSLSVIPVSIAIAAVAAYLVLPQGRRASELMGEELVVATSVFAAWIIMSTRRGDGAWNTTRWLAAANVVLAASAAILLVVDLASRRAPHSGVGDSLFLAFLVPVVGAVRCEFRVHLPADDRREVAVDAALICASLAAIAYVMIRPDGASITTSISAAVFAIVAAVSLTSFGVLSLWVPRPAHLSQWIVFAAVAAATAALGTEWTRGTFDGTSRAIDLTFIVAGPALATSIALFPRHRQTRPDPRPGRFARPLLTTLSVASACAALAMVAAVGHDHGIRGRQSATLIALLGLFIAARILVNQIRSTQAAHATRQALAGKEGALAEADRALERVREANETLRQSEEHLRLVFDAAVDGIVELDEREVILRANEAFCRMVHLDRVAIEGLPWSGLAAVVNGGDASFASLLSTGEGTIHRTEGQPLYLESRISDVPMTPPRRLLLVRDVTAGRVADQTIRKLFKFLQDRDEDRSRLLRRSNAAIESERNRIARDLHDGPVQGVSAASLSLEAVLLMLRAGDTERGVEILTKIRGELAEEAESLRRLMSGLRPPVLEERGLVPALRETLVRFGAENDVHAEFKGTVSESLPDDLETLAYRIVQEALSNAAKHADAAYVGVSVEADQHQMRIEVTDDGRGFDHGQAREFLRMGRVGLASMRERVELASGTLVVRSTPGRGTTLVATLPVDVVVISREPSALERT